MDDDLLLQDFPSLDSTDVALLLDNLDQNQNSGLGISGLEKHAPFFVSLKPGCSIELCLRATAAKGQSLFVWPGTLGAAATATAAAGCATYTLVMGTFDHFAVESLGSLSLISKLELSRIFGDRLKLKLSVLNTVRTFVPAPGHPFNLLLAQEPAKTTNCRLIPIIGISKDVRPNPNPRWNSMIRGRETWLSEMSDCGYDSRYDVVGVVLHVFRGDIKAGTVMRLELGLV